MALCKGVGPIRLQIKKKRLEVMKVQVHRLFHNTCTRFESWYGLGFHFFLGGVLVGLVCTLSTTKTTTDATK